MDKVNFKVLSLNVGRIRSSIKRKPLFLWLNNQKTNIVVYKETYSTTEVEAIWKTQCKGKMFYSRGTNHSCGVLVLVRKDLEFETK